MARMTWTSDEGVTYERISGTVRKQAGLWVPIADDGHCPVGDWQVDSWSDTALTIIFPPKLQVVGAGACPDETLASWYQASFGPSVGLDRIVIRGRSTQGPFNFATWHDSTTENIWFWADFVVTAA